MDLTSLIVVVYVLILCVTAVVRFYTEGGYWQAIHTGRTLMLQAATLMVGMWFAHQDLARRVSVLKPFLPNPIPAVVSEATTSAVARVLADPGYVLMLGMIGLVGYMLTGFQEQSFLRREGDNPFPRKFIGPNQEPTRLYKVFIAGMLFLGESCLLGAWYFVVASKPLSWYLTSFVLPAYLLWAFLIFAGPFIATRTRGTGGRPQQWGSLPKPEE